MCIRDRVVTPYYNKCTQNGLLRHYEAVAGSTDKPIIVYNVPTRTCVNIEPVSYTHLSIVRPSAAQRFSISRASGRLSSD